MIKARIGVEEAYAKGLEKTANQVRNPKGPYIDVMYPTCFPFFLFASETCSGSGVGGGGVS